MTPLKKVLVIFVLSIVVCLIVPIFFQNSGPLSLVDNPQTEAYVPPATAMAVDISGTLTPEQLLTLNTKLQDFPTEIGVLVVNTTSPLSIDEYGMKVAETWGVGDGQLDNGVVVILAAEDRTVRIEVGYGMEGDITDAEAGRIIDNFMIPHLVEEEWYDALVAGVDEINNNVTSE